MENLVQNAVLIEKEIISNLSFKKAPISHTQSPELLQKLHEAMRLGNNFRGKVAIIFQDDDGLKRVETTIWATGAKYICLKGGTWLPISHVVDVKMI